MHLVYWRLFWQEISSDGSRGVEMLLRASVFRGFFNGARKPDGSFQEMHIVPDAGTMPCAKKSGIPLATDGMLHGFCGTECAGKLTPVISGEKYSVVARRG